MCVLPAFACTFNSGKLSTTKWWAAVATSKQNCVSQTWWKWYTKQAAHKKLSWKTKVSGHKTQSLINGCHYACSFSFLTKRELQLGNATCSLHSTLKDKILFQRGELWTERDNGKMEWFCCTYCCCTGTSQEKRKQWKSLLFFSCLFFLCSSWKSLLSSSCSSLHRWLLKDLVKLWIIWNYFWSAYLVICGLISLINFAVFGEIYWVVSVFAHLSTHELLAVIAKTGQRCYLLFASKFSANRPFFLGPILTITDRIKSPKLLVLNLHLWYLFRILEIAQNPQLFVCQWVALHLGKGSKNWLVFGSLIGSQQWTKNVCKASVWCPITFFLVLVAFLRVHLNPHPLFGINTSVYHIQHRVLIIFSSPSINITMWSV